MYRNYGKKRPPQTSKNIAIIIFIQSNFYKTGLCRENSNDSSTVTMLADILLTTPFFIERTYTPVIGSRTVVFSTNIFKTLNITRKKSKKSNFP